MENGDPILNSQREMDFGGGDEEHVDAPAHEAGGEDEEIVDFDEEDGHVSIMSIWAVILLLCLTLRTTPKRRRRRRTTRNTQRSVSWLWLASFQRFAWAPAPRRESW